MSERLTDNSTLFRLRVRYGKRDRLKYLGHLEVIHTIERIVRRAGLPYAVTQGFSPHMRVGFSSALPVGTSSTCEWYDLFMTEFVALDERLGAWLLPLRPIWPHRGRLHRRAHAGADGATHASVLSYRSASRS